MSDPLPPLDDTRDDRPSHRADESYTPADESETTGSRVGAGRHMASLLLCLLLVPAAYVLFDYSSLRAMQHVGTELDSSVLPSRVILTAGVAAFCLFLAAAAGRISALGPLVAGLVWGAGLSVWVFVDFLSFSERLRDIPDPFDSFGVALLSVGFALFPATGGLLIGTAIAGRWKGSRA